MEKKLIIFALAALVWVGCTKEKDPTMDRSDFVAITDVIPDTYFDFPITF